MARERIISPSKQKVDAQVEATSAAPTKPSIRPVTLDQYLGQSELRERLSIALDAAKERNDPMEHVLLYGPPGLGKTTLAHVIANELGTRAWVTSGPALTKGSDLVGTLTRMEPNDVLFIDEIHRL
ncbi:MAG: AAA family ATPase, partial [Phycisphaerae bacterium]|nr:AAA family ATPase [Phycisphaerae bacterium]